MVNVSVEDDGLVLMIWSGNHPAPWPALRTFYNPSSTSVASLQKKRGALGPEKLQKCSLRAFCFIFPLLSKIKPGPHHIQSLRIAIRFVDRVKTRGQGERVRNTHMRNQVLARLPGL